MKNLPSDHLKCTVSWLICCLALMMIGGCQSVSSAGKDEMSEQEKEQNQIKILVDAFALPKASARSLQNMCEKLIQYGEKAVPELGKNIENRMGRVRQLCIYCLGMIYCNTKSPMVAELKPKLVGRIKTDYIDTVRLEAATLLCILEDYQGVDLLINALRSDRAYIRMTAYQALFDVFKRSFNYNYNEDVPKREQATRLWEKWWLENQAKYLSNTTK